MKCFSKLIPIVLSIIITTQLYAQPAPMKFGKISMNDMKMEKYEADPDAAAVVLCDYGMTNFYLSRGTTEFRRHRRIKILNKAGFDWADISIRYNPKYSGVTGIKGVTYVLEGGKIVEHKLSKKTIADEAIVDSKYSQKKISMPNVQEGAIIEYIYTVTYRRGGGIRNWYFQNVEPTLHSEYRVRIPQYYTFANYYQGTQALEINTDQSYSESENINGRPLSYTGRYYRKVAQNIPALREEPYMTTPDDYRAKAGFQLQSINIPGSMMKTYMEDWEKVAEELWEREYFGGALKGFGNSAVKKEVERVVAGKETDEEKMIAIYNYVKSKIEWNGSHTFRTTQSLNKVLDEKSGYSGEINLMLILMLQEADIYTMPAILSTRDHGKMQPIYPFLDQFNHVIAFVMLNGEEYWLDAIHKNRPYNLLDDEDLNHRAFVVHPKTPQWKDLKSAKKYTHVANATFKLTEDGSMIGGIDCSDKDYSAFYKRIMLNADGEEKFANEVFEKDLPDMELESYTFENLEEITQPLKATYKMTINSAATVADKRIYINPMLNEGMTKNPFTLEERTFPVDYGHGYSNTYILNLELPEGYEVEELPEPTRMVLPNKGGAFTYNNSAVEGKLQLISKLSINQTVFEPEEYKGLKEFYNLIVAKHAEQIVLKKSE